MSSVNLVQNVATSALMAKPLARAVPSLGAGVGLFEEQPSAAGNSQLHVQSTGANIRIVA